MGTTTINLSSVNGTNGFLMHGEPYDRLGTSVNNAGDVNGDGFDDLIGGALLQLVQMVSLVQILFM